MRASFTIAVLSAAGAIATTSVYVQPISQISDGQIQAPPATSLPAASSSVYIPAPPATTSEVVVPSSGAPEVPESSVTVVIPIPPAGNSTVPAVPSYVNSTIATVSTGAPATTGAPVPTSGSPGGSPTASAPPQGTGAANANMVNMASFGGLVLAVAGLLV